MGIYPRTPTQVVGKRKKLLDDMGKAMISEIRKPLEPFGAEAVELAVSELTDRLNSKVLANSSDWYNVDSQFQTAVSEAIEAKSVVLEDVERMPMDAENVDLNGWNGLTKDDRRAMVVSWLQSGPAVKTLKCAVE